MGNLNKLNILGREFNAGAPRDRAERLAQLPVAMRRHSRPWLRQDGDGRHEPCSP